MVDPFEITAMALDTLPQGGRALLMALLLSVTLYGIARAIKGHPSNAMRLLFRKGAALVLVGLPALLWIIGLQMPVYVAEARHFSTPWPSYVFYGVLTVWALGTAVMLFVLARRAHATGQHVLRGDGDTTLDKRCVHWSRRLGMQRQIEVGMDGGEHAWCWRGRILLPHAARGWKRGLQDVVLLNQLAHIKLNHGWWLLAAHGVSALYWPMPWVKNLLQPMSSELAYAASALAAAAYRDPAGWVRDVRQVEQRYETLLAVGSDEDWLRLPGEVALDAETVQQAAPADVEQKWAATRERRAQKYFDPYERVYWLIAVVSLVVGAGTTLTIEQASPEMEPRFLQVRWQDQMGRRLGDVAEQAPRRGPTQESTDAEPAP
ncbi:MAG: hypothetical protein AAF529_15660 [Pseudomonadota bacterium]